jgi:hypothetical protein
LGGGISVARPAPLIIASFDQAGPRHSCRSVFGTSCDPVDITLLVPLMDFVDMFDRFARTAMRLSWREEGYMLTLSAEVKHDMEEMNGSLLEAPAATAAAPVMPVHCLVEPAHVCHIAGNIVLQEQLRQPVRICLYPLVFRQALGIFLVVGKDIAVDAVGTHILVAPFGSEVQHLSAKGYLPMAVAEIVAFGCPGCREWIGHGDGLLRHTPVCGFEQVDEQAAYVNPIAPQSIRKIAGFIWGCNCAHSNWYFFHGFMKDMQIGGAFATKLKRCSRILRHNPCESINF